jgi:hypothetical protein
LKLGVEKYRVKILLKLVAILFKLRGFELLAATLASQALKIVSAAWYLARCLPVYMVMWEKTCFDYHFSARIT